MSEKSGRSQGADNESVDQTSKNRPSPYQESKCPAYWLVPDIATACELHELNKQIARLIELTAKK